MMTSDETEILRLKDRIYDLKQYSKALELQEDEKAFKHRCIPQKRADAQKDVMKSVIPLIILTLLGVNGLKTAVLCLLLLFKESGGVSAGLGIYMMGTLILGIGGCIFGIRLWIFVLRKVSDILYLNVQEKQLHAELVSLHTKLQELGKEIEICASELAERKEADYLRTIDYDEEVDMDNLRKYLSVKFAKHSELEKRIGAPEVVAELRRFGYRTIGDIDKAFASEPEDFFIPEEGTNGAGILRNVMIIKDCHKYFTQAYRGGWLQIPIERVKFWQERGATDVEPVLKEYGIEIKL